MRQRLPLACIASATYCYYFRGKSCGPDARTTAAETGKQGDSRGKSGLDIPVFFHASFLVRFGIFFEFSSEMIALLEGGRKME